MHSKIFALTILAASLSLPGCDDTVDPAEMAAPIVGDPDYVRDPALDVENISAPDEQRSHNMGTNCMSCHQSHGDGVGQFSIAGTIHDEQGIPLANPVLELRTAPDRGGEIVVALEGDNLGNVFSTEPIDIAEQPLYVWVGNADETLQAMMPFSTRSGSCNHCHAGGFRVTVKAPLPPEEGDSDTDAPPE